HHAYLPLWGSPAANALPCVTWTAMTILVATSRTVTGQHNMSDNVFGIGTGVASALVPWSLHYAPWQRRGTRASGAGHWPVVVGLVAEDDGLGVQVSGLLR